MISWNYILAAAGALLVFLLYKEWKRKNRARLYLRMAASLLAMASLLFMAYPYAGNSHANASKKILLLTDGFIKDSLDHFLQQTNAAIPVFSDHSVRLQNNNGNTVQLVTGWTAFAASHAADTIHVFGNGLSTATLALLEPHPIVFHASPGKPGISHVYWKQQLQTGEPLTVQGHYENNTGQQIKIILQAFGTSQDTAFIAAGASEDFSLQVIPRHRGRAVFSLIAVAGKDTLQKEPVPLEVQTTVPLKLLILSSSPDFENTFLKNYFSQQGWQVTVITTISSNKISRQFLNTPVQQQAGRLTIPYLTGFDLLMADEEALQKLNAAELAAIRNVVKEKGIGLVARMDAQKKQGLFYSPFFPVKLLPPVKQPFLALRGAVSDSTLFRIKITASPAIAYIPGTQVILQDGQSNIYASCMVYGSGTIVATTLENTYSIALAGNIAAYQQLWRLLLNKAARKVYQQEIWQTNLFIPYVNNPVLLQAEGNDTLLQPRAVTGNTSIYLKQDALLPFQWQGMYWPAANGWQLFPRLYIPPGAWYVYKDSEWKQLTDHIRLTGTKKYAALHPVSPAGLPVYRSGSFSVSPSLFMLFVFLSSCIFLWVEQKMV